MAPGPSAAVLLALCALPVRCPAAALGEEACPAGVLGREGVCVPRQALLQLRQGRARAAVLDIEEGTGTPGSMTMWSGSPTTIVGGSCEYANAANGGLASPAATSPYVANRAYCAADHVLYAGGATCGSCFRVSYDGSPATDPGRPGSLVVQIVDSGSAKTFDCQMDAYEAITGATTGIFPVTYEPVECETAVGGAVVTVLDGNNAWYTKVIFSNLPQSVLSADLTVGSKSFTMQRNSGATWYAHTGGATGTASFIIKLAGGGMVSLVACFGSWPVPTGSQCNEGPTATTQAATTTTAAATTTPAAMHLPAWTSMAPWQHVNGGVGRACRGATPSDSSSSYYTLHTGVTSIDACRDHCAQQSSCTGIEYGSASGRCEVWTTTIGASKAASGYTCLRYSGAAAPSPPPAATGPWEGVGGGAGRACRGASASDNSNSYYELHVGVTSINGCKARCESATSCTGIEYKSDGGRCEVWTTAIGASKAANGYTCLRRSADAAPSSTPAATGPWEAVGGGAGRACRGASAGDNSNSYYELHTSVASVDGCKARCASTATCTGIEYRSAGGRCEVWTAAIGASVPASGFQCLRYAASTSTLAPATTTMAPPGPQAGCSDAGSDCRATRCCSDPGQSCYEKNAYWASCRSSCTPGSINPHDPPAHRTPWSCELLGGSGAGPGPSPGPAPAPGPTPAPSGWVTGTWTTGYWDCCKPSCSWPGKGRVNRPVLACDVATGATLADANARSACDGGPAASCASNRPFNLSAGLSMGFAAAAVGGGHGLAGDENCGQCYELRFKAQRHDPQGDNWGGAHPGLAGKAMVVQVTNIGYDVQGHHSFDLQIPGAGQGLFTNGCTRQFPGHSTADFDCGNNYGGCSARSGCARLPPELRPGCEWRFDWYRWLVAEGQTNNPYVDFRRVRCPAQLAAISGSTPSDDGAYPEVDVSAYA